MQSRKPILVVGGGIAGVTAAVEIAETGYEVVLVEKEAYLGGNVIKMNNYFPKLCPPACGLEINFRRIKNNARVKVLTHTQLEGIEGEKGNFRVKLNTSPRLVNDNCTSCGKCAEVCQVERPDAFNYNMGSTKAAYLPHAMAFPSRFNIDPEYCEKEACKKCLEVCEYEAIDLRNEGENVEIEASSVLMATGWENYDAALIDNLHYANYKDVVSNVEFERLLAPNGPGQGKVKRPSDGREPMDVAFVQCAGSRDENHLPWCSAVCCSASLKHALNIVEKNPKAKVKIFYIDLRVSGRNEDFLTKVQEHKNIELVKGKAGNVETGDNDQLVVTAEDILSGRKISYAADMVVLATGIKPSGNGLISGEYNSGNGLKDGIYAIGCSRKPMDVSSSLKDATAAALKAIQ